MKALIVSTLLGLSMIAGPVQAKDQKSIWTTLSESAPRSVCEWAGDMARNCSFNGIQVGELQPVFETLRDNAP